ncbi:hypothetical protein MAR_009024, partial [Mya arenaria]
MTRAFARQRFNSLGQMTRMSVLLRIVLPLLQRVMRIQIQNVKLTCAFVRQSLSWQMTRLSVLLR